MQLIRKTLFWIHLVVGLTVGLGVAVMAGTGLLMAFQHPIVRWAERADAPPPAGVRATANQAWSASRLLAAAADAVPDATPTGLTADADLTRPAAVQFGRDRVLYLNNFTGEVVGHGAPRLRAFFSTVEGLHRWLALAGTGREWGRAVTHAVCLGFLFLIASGIYLWVPRRLRWQSFRPVLLPNLRLRGKARDWNWHNVIGFWLAVPLLVIALTGTVMAYPWANRLLYRAVGEVPPTLRGDRGPDMRGGRRGEGDRHRPSVGGGQRALNLDGLDDLWDAAESAAAPGWTSMSIQVGGGRRGGGGEGNDAAAGGRGGVPFMFAYGNPELPYNRVTLTFDRGTGDLLRTERFADQTRGRRLRSLVVPIHRGEILGVPGMALAAVACVGALALVYTGFALAWRRLVRPLLARRESSVVEDTARATAAV